MLRTVSYATQYRFTITNKPLQELWSIFNVTVISISAILTSLLSITRYLKIIRPFTEFRIRPLLFYIALNVIFLVAVLMRNIMFCGPGHPVTGKPYWLRFQQISWRETDVTWQMAVAVPYLAHCLVSLITSLLTIYHLQKTKRSVITETRAKCRQSSWAIVLMNLGNTLFLLLMTTSIALHALKPTIIYTLLKINFMKDCLSPCFLSAINPLIFYLCCRDSRNKLWRVWHGSRLRAQILKYRSEKKVFFSSSDPQVVVKDVVFGQGAGFSKSESEFQLRPAAPPLPPTRLKRGGHVIRNRACVSSLF